MEEKVYYSEKNIILPMSIDAKFLGDLLELEY